MDITASTIIIGIIAVLLISFLVVIKFYKPSKELIIKTVFKDDDGKKYEIIEVTIENKGKVKAKVIYPFIKFSSGFKSKIFQSGKSNVNCTFPKMLDPEESFTFEINISKFKEAMEKESFRPSEVIVIADDMAGLEFKSEPLAMRL